jgi:5-oxopent-3-ene-1,2,5-tricarboxylate decarboxylase/2-hydroxyhepta-2,4-diene-1,7-dioate isomerase
MFQSFPSVAAPPFRLSGVVHGTLLNDPAVLAALGDAVNQPPYKAAPKAPVLYLKPRNTLAASGSLLASEGLEFELGAALGLVVGRSICRADEAGALQCLAGVVLMADLCLPHNTFYRPSVRLRARDGSCVIGPRVATDRRNPDALTLHLRIDGETVQRIGTAGRVRGAAKLLADVSEFMTLRPGDILMTGVAAGAPRVRAGQRFEIEADGLGCLTGALA